jgi:hypothetical protein
MMEVQSAVLNDYGLNVSPQAGNTMAGLSSETIRDLSDPGFVAPNPGTDLGSVDSPPAHYLATHGGVLPTNGSCEGACPTGSDVRDSVNLRLTVRVPTNAVGFSYKYRYFSAEYGGACSLYNDFHLTQLSSSAAGIPNNKNITFDSQGNPTSVNNLFWETCTPERPYLPLGHYRPAGDRYGCFDRWRNRVAYSYGTGGSWRDN